MTDKLKRCPFCGGDNTDIISADIIAGTQYWRIYCYGCGCTQTPISSKEEAIEKWNNRPSPWHTGTPTEEGWYLLKLVDEYGRITYDANYLRKGIKGREWKYAFFGHVIIKWQSIEDEPEVMMG